ncbi:hypothetical protein [Bacillus sp. FJAT-45350]|uniref:hypothetical protein n=1 Tax=Bacillus sp. FJAT-45350 TaxID=2011014 RepID=UPI000BB7DF67|nr:hypothetical protein [Bacillus sp. FJAT-45350]
MNIRSFINRFTVYTSLFFILSGCNDDWVKEQILGINEGPIEEEESQEIIVDKPIPIPSQVDGELTIEPFDVVEAIGTGLISPLQHIKV